MSYLLPWINLFALAVAFALVAKAWGQLGRWLDTQDQTATLTMAERAFYEAVGRAGGIAKLAFMAGGGLITNPAALAAAAKAGAEYLQSTVPGTLAEKGIGPDKAGAMAAAEMGRVLGWPDDRVLDNPSAAATAAAVVAPLLSNVAKVPA